MNKHNVSLFFRKLRSTGSFSIEASFDRMIECFPENSELTLNKYTSSYYSNGLIARVLGMLEARKQCNEVNHVTGDVHFYVLAMPGKKTILTVHDCGLMNHPNLLVRFLLKLIWLDFPVRHCRYVTAVSHATKQEIIHYTGCKPDKIIVIPTIITGEFKKYEKAFNEQCPRILHIGLAPNKNFNRHVQAISGLNCEFHIIGKLQSHHRQILENYRIRWSSESNISQQDMQRAYQDSDIVLFASMLEGFGMPILEAQTIGIPVVTSNISSMPEVAGEAACQVDPYDVKSIKEGILKVIENREYRNSIIEKGFKNVKRYQAKSVAQQYENLYKKVLKE